nr:tail fiber domain-containing protein [Agrobacterium tumefaciens]
MALALSDRRLKRNIKRIGRLSNGLNVYRYRYLWGKEVHVGLMADEVRRVVPDAVVKHATGFDMVDYSKVA